MTQLHDFEFQLGKNKALKGRGWRGLLALCLLLITCATIVSSGKLQICLSWRGIWVRGAGFYRRIFLQAFQELSDDLRSRRDHP
jgi:hypothetical protein